MQISLYSDEQLATSRCHDDTSTKSKLSDCRPQLHHVASNGQSTSSHSEKNVGRKLRQARNSLFDALDVHAALKLLQTFSLSNVNYLETNRNFHFNQYANEAQYKKINQSKYFRFFPVNLMTQHVQSLNRVDV